MRAQLVDESNATRRFVKIDEHFVNKTIEYEDTDKSSNYDLIPSVEEKIEHQSILKKVESDASEQYVENY